MQSHDSSYVQETEAVCPCYAGLSGDTGEPYLARLHAQFGYFARKSSASLARPSDLFSAGL